jgi:SOS-response transcriptional repressor LexA
LEYALTPATNPDSVIAHAPLSKFPVQLKYLTVFRVMPYCFPIEVAYRCDVGAARRVFLSHTSELRQYPLGRSFISAAESAVTRAGDVVTDMAYFAAQDTASADTCRQAVGAADVYVLIAGFCYGSPVRDRPDASYTELEFETATQMGKPRFAFLLDENAEGSRYLFADKDADRQLEFRKRVSNELSVATFANPDQLETRIYQALTSPQVRRVSPSGEQHTAPSTEAFPALVEQAQKRLQNLLTVLQRTGRVMEEVKYSSTKPAGMDDWESFAAQNRRHEEIAASITDPAADLTACSEQASQAARDAGEYVRRLSARHFSSRASKLASVIKIVTELQAMSRELADRVAETRRELTERAEDYPDYYRTPCAALSEAYELIDQASRNVTWMKQALDRLLTPETGSSAGTSPTGQRPNPDVTGSNITRTVETDAVPIQVLGRAAATPPGAMNAQDGDDLVWIPEDYARRDGVFSVRVDGDSMSGDGIYEGDFVIVDPNQRPEDGNIAVVRTGGPDDTQTLVKRVRLSPNGELQSLESSNPRYPPMAAQSLERPYAQGKVIGVFRHVG